MMQKRVVAMLGLLLITSSLVWAKPWSVAVFCDSRGVGTGEEGSTQGVRSSVLRAIAADACREHVALVVFPGDQVNGSAKYGTLAEQLLAWKTAMAPLYHAHIPIYSFRGNHENQQEAPVKVWDAIFPDLPKNGPKGQEDLTYSVRFQNAEFIGFDQYVGRSATFDTGKYDDAVNTGIVSPWVLAQITNAPTPWVFVFGHEPAFIAHHTDCLANAPAERDALWEALGARNGVYFCGHDHLYVRRTAPDSHGHPVTELIVGCAGAPNYPYDHEALNTRYDQHVAPTAQFVNATPTREMPNTNGSPFYFGYLIITVDGNTATGRWKAFINYDYAHWDAPPHPVFRVLDSFVLKTSSKK